MIATQNPFQEEHELVKFTPEFDAGVRAFVDFVDNTINISDKTVNTAALLNFMPKMADKFIVGILNSEGISTAKEQLFVWYTEYKKLRGATGSEKLLPTVKSYPDGTGFELMKELENKYEAAQEFSLSHRHAGH